MPDIATIILAAGYSSRMQGCFKPLLRLGASTVVERVVNAHLAAGVRDVRVVVGHRAEEVMETLRNIGLCMVRNEDFDKGMFSSVQAGAASLGPGLQAFFIHPVDIPLVRPATIRAMREACEKNPGSVIYPAYKGKRGHPPLIPGKYVSEILTSPAPDGLRGILKNHEADARNVEVDDEAVLMDIDTPADYHRLLSREEKRGVPDRGSCLKLLDEAHVQEHVREHCRMVAAVACQLGQLLNQRGAGLDEKLITAAALLHDIKRHEKDHARCGALFLHERGYARVADIVAAHMDIGPVSGESPTEAEVVYIADKLVSGKCRVALSERFAAALERHKEDEKACLSITRRLEQAEKIMRKLEHILGRSLEGLPPAHLAHAENEMREVGADA